MDLPDVAYQVASFLKQNDRARLAQVSRLHFHLIMPLAWHTVAGATQLFELLPGVSIENAGLLMGTETICLPKNLDTTDFTRFKFYAQLVKHFLLFKNPAVVIKINRWRELLQYTSKNTLLPFLSSICLGTYWPQSIPYYPWIAAFSSPSVQRIEIQPLVRRNLPTVSSEIASALVDLLIDKCPNIESFSIFVDHKQRTSPLETGFHTSAACRQGNNEALLEAIEQVQSLACTSSLAEHFQSTFSLLGRFPRLETLHLYASRQDEPHMIPVSPLQQETFSQLRNLTLYDFGPHTTLSILNNLASATELTQVTLEINFSKDNKDEVSDIDGFCNTTLIPTICARIPRLTHLAIRPMRDDKFHVAINDSSLELLASLRLQSLTLAQSHADVEYIATHFSPIQTLRLPDQSVTLSQLRYFATYPQLELLSMKLDLSSSHTIVPLCNSAVLPTVPCVLESDFSSFDHLSQDKIHKLLVRFIGIWSRPLTLQQIIPFDYPHRDFAAERRLRHLNTELERIQLAIF